MSEITLTADQQAALDEMLQFPPTFILKGYAGTGKTFLLKEFIHQASGTFNIVLTATPHKALGVADGDHTIHSYLGLKLQKEKDKQVLVESGRHKIQYNDLVIIDESSMVSSEILQFILKAQEAYELTLVFVGDPAQLPPVGEDISPVWNLSSLSFMLTQIVRQAADSNIIKLATKIRTGAYTRQDILDCVDNSTVFAGTMPQAQKFFIENITQSEDGSHVFPQIISYRNVVVNELNTWARRQVLGDLSKNKYNLGETLYIRSSFEKCPFRLEDFVEIEEMEEPRAHSLWGHSPVQTVKMYVRNIYTGASDTITVPLSPRDMMNFEDNKSQLGKEARATKRWKPFWDYAESLVDVKHIYAMTCHRSQGSTFQDVIVNKTDIAENRLFYTAVTRAAKRLFLAM